LSGFSFTFPSGISSLDRLTGSRPRFLLHGVVAAVSVAAIASIALQPRSAAPDPTRDAAALQLDKGPSQLALGLEPMPAPTDGDAQQTATPAPESQAATENEAEVAPPAKPITHTVEEGETLRMLAARFGLSPETIMAANNLRNPDLLRVGQDLVILPTDGVLYTIRAGETIRKVAERFGVETMDIVKANDLGADPDLVQPGTLLMVPGATPVTTGRYARVVRTGDADQQAAGIGGGLPIELVADAAPSTRTYEVQSGDTLAGIAATFGVDVSTILSSNGISDPDTIKPGTELRILPVRGIEYAVEPNETLADIAWKYQVDLGLLLDYNDLNDPDVIRVGAKLVLPGGKLRPEAIPTRVPVVEPGTAPAVTTAGGGAAVQVAVPKPAAAPAPRPAAAAASKPAAATPSMTVGSGGANIVSNAMKYVGYRYTFGGTSPAGFDCSGFVYYIHNHSGAPVGRGMWQQYNGGAHIPMSALQPGDTVFFANTYMPGLSHDGIYVGGGQFVHASDERTGVTVSSLYSGYWQAHYVGATRLWD
jgi:cell wall-associated NlpC family hydrolase/nucleoid-associated protein YgaU